MLNHIAACLLFGVTLASPIAASGAADPVLLFIDYCFEANRLEGHAQRPSEDSSWALVGADIRSTLGIGNNPDISVYRYLGSEERSYIFLKIHERILETGRFSKGEKRHTCEIIYSGPKKPETIREDLSEFFGARAYTGSFLWNAGFKQREGWQQWCWAKDISRRSKNWKLDKNGCTTVMAKSFFQRAELILMRLQVQEEGDPPVAVIGLEWTFRPDRDAQDESG